MSRRTCTSCGAYLRSTNQESICGPCDLTETRVALEREIREQRLHTERYRMYLAHCEGKQTMTAKILRALPGTAAEVADAVGGERRRVGRLLSRLVSSGVIEKSGGFGNQHVRAIYSAPEAPALVEDEAA